MRFFNKNLERIYRYIFIHDDETILIKDMASELNICRQTCSKFVKWLIKRELIKKSGKHFKIIPTA